jgi:hypothetical protein
MPVNNKNRNKEDRINHPELRRNANLVTILASYANRLREHPKLNEQNVVVSDQAIPLVMPGGRFCISVSFGSATFPRAAWDGGHHATATCDGKVVIGIYQQVMLDRPGRSEAALLHDESILKWLQVVLSMLTVASPRSRERSQAWEPWIELSDVPGSDQYDWVYPALREIPVPTDYSAVADVPGHSGWIGMQINFACKWDWDLYAVDY